MFIVSFFSPTPGPAVDTLSFFNDSPTSPVKVTLSGMVVMGVKESGVLPAEFSLSQNYPNPFNPSTTIEFSLPKRAIVNLTIYNTLGQIVETLISSEMEAGAHQVIWKANNIPSGTYFYRLIANNFVETKKMLLMK
ncbi:MAG: T9SS type A sorting domain-containing protein [Patescibacteria group bacterium]